MKPQNVERPSPFEAFGNITRNFLWETNTSLWGVGEFLVFFIIFSALICKLLSVFLIFNKKIQKSLISLGKKKIKIAWNDFKNGL